MSKEPSEHGNKTPDGSIDKLVAFLLHQRPRIFGQLRFTLPPYGFV